RAAACTTRSAAASTVTRWTRTGSSHTSRRCSTTTPSSPRCTSRAGSPSAIPSAGAFRRRRSTISCARWRTRRVASTPRPTPTPRATRGSSSSGRRRSCARSSAQRTRSRGRATGRPTVGRTRRAGEPSMWRAKLKGYLEDYAMVAAALVALYEATLDRRWLDEARGLAEELLRLFWDEKLEGFYDTGVDHERLIVRPRNLFDNAVPCGSSVAI